MVLEGPEKKIRGKVFNLGTPEGNYTKDEIVGLILKRMPETVVEYKDLTFGGDMRDITVSFDKIKRELGFETTLTVDDGVREVLFALKTGLIRNPADEKYRNAQFIVQYGVIRMGKGYWQDKRGIVTGGTGFLGAFVILNLRDQGATDIFIPTSQEYALTDNDPITHMLDASLSNCPGADYSLTIHLPAT